MALGEDLIMRVRLLDARQAALEAKMVADEMKRVGGTSEEAGLKARKSTSGFSAMGGSIKSLIGMAGVAGLAFGFKDLVKSGIAWQSTQLQLGESLKHTGQYSKSAVDAINNAAASLSQRGGFSETQSVNAISQFTMET